ncbi:MAG: glycosyltransferase family 4 protein [Candidatus Taylorbacteria bacterium]|nr:glycosyltransferase family 4 protein [Candidatus Taylorbacteria bacterium]
MRHILIFSLGYYPRFVAGAEVAIKEITDRISPQEIEFDMVTFRYDRQLPRFEMIGNVNVYRVGGGMFGKAMIPVIGTRQVLRMLKKNQYDCFWAMMVTFSSGIPYLVNILRRFIGQKKIPVALTLQEGDSDEHIRTKKFGIAGLIWRILMFPVSIFLPKELRKLGLIGISWALALRRTDRITVLSKYLENQAIKYGYKGSIEVIPNAVDFDLFSKPISIIEANLLKEKLGKKENDIFLITTSRLVKKNAIDDLIQSLNYLPANIKLLILGVGPKEEEFKNIAAKLDKPGTVSDRVQFLGFVPHSEMPKYLQASDIFIRPSLSEGLGNSFLEAMAAGIPVIATAVGGIPDFLKDGETGLFCEVSNPKSIAQKVEKLIKDRESREHIIKQAREMVKDNYQWEMVAEKMKGVFMLFL